MKLFTVVYAGEDYSTAEPVLYSDQAELVRLVVAYLADTVDRTEIVPERKPSTRRRRSEEQGVSA